MHGIVMNDHFMILSNSYLFSNKFRTYRTLLQAFIHVGDLQNITWHLLNFRAGGRLLFERCT